MPENNSDKKSPSTPEGDSTDRSFHFRGIPTTEAEQKAKKAKNAWLPIQLQSEAYD